MERSYRYFRRKSQARYRVVRRFPEDMKICLLQDDFPPHAKGGAGMVAASFARELAKRGHEVTVVTAVQDHSQTGSFQEDGMRVERIYSDYAPRWRSWLSLYNPAAVGRVNEILSEVKPDVVHAHNVHYHLSYWTLRLAKKSGARVFLTAHDVMLFHYGKLTEFIDPKHAECHQDWNYKVSAWQQFRNYRFWYNPFRNIVIRRVLRNVDKIFAVSAALRAALEQNGIRNVEVLHNGIDAAAWEVSSQATEAFVRSHGLEGKKIILFGGRISGLKGGGVMLAALRNVVQKESTAVLLLLGKRDAYVERLVAQAKEWGIEASVVSTGWLSGEELRAAYHAATVVAAPSLYLDPLPTVVLEAMACGKPVVGSCFGGIPEMVIDGETGAIASLCESAKLVACLCDFLKDTEKRVRFGRAGYARVARQFSLGQWYEVTLSAYTKGQ